MQFQATFGWLFAQRERNIYNTSIRSVLSERSESKGGIIKSMWYVYILLCEDKSLYTGISNNPQKRFLDHRNGKGGRYTRLHKPTKIIYLEELSSKSGALRRENQIKGWNRVKKIEILNLKF